MARVTAKEQGRKSRAEFLLAYAKHRDLDDALDDIGKNRAWLYKNTGRWADFRASYQAMKRTVSAPGENDPTDHAVEWDHTFAGFRHAFLGRSSPWFHEQICEQMDAQVGGDIDLMIWPPEHGKGLGLDTPLPTPDGWTTMGEVRTGDLLLGRDGAPTRVVATSRVHRRDSYRVTFSGGSSLIADDEHQWFVRRRDRSWKNPETKERGLHTDTITTVELAERYEHLGRPNFSVPVLDALDLPDADLPIDPYVLGAWLGDGTTSDGSISKPEPELWANIELAGYRTSPGWGRQAMTRTVYGLKVQLRALEVLGNKHIPSIYLRASRKQRMALLHGLMDTDGSCGTRGNCEFSSVTPALADGAEELIRTLGIKVRRYVTRAMLKGVDYGPNYRLNFHTGEQVFRIARKAERQNTPRQGDREHREMIVRVERVPTVLTRCVFVDAQDGLYLAGREMHVTHNTSLVEDRCTMDVTTDPTKRITIGKGKIDFAKMMVATVRQRLGSGVFDYWKLRERFGPFEPMLGQNAFQQAQVWSADAFNVFKRKLGAERDFNMQALGFGSEVAGTRCDRLYLDDVQSRKTLNLTDSILETLRDDWFPRPGTTGNTVILMNVVGDDDIADRMFDDQLLTNRSILKAYDDAYLELGPRPNKDGDMEPSPWLWPERYSEADYERMRQIAGPEGWARKYQQDWRPSVGRSFTAEMIALCQNELRKISHPPPRHPADKPAEIACSIDPAFKRTAVASAAFEPTIMRVLDVNAESNLRTTGQMIDLLADQIRHWHRPPNALVKWVIVETKGMAQGIVTDDALLELQAEIGFEIIEQVTGWDKHDEDFGVAQMARSMTRAELDFPAGDEESIARFDDLYREMKNWRPEVKAKNRGNKLRQDGLMTIWFLWTRWHKQRRKSIRRGVDASAFGFGGVPTMAGFLTPAPIRAPDLTGWRFGQTVGGR